MTIFGESINEKDFDYNIILKSALDIKQSIIERNRTLGGINGYDFQTDSVIKGQYNNTEKRWVRILPDFNFRSARLTLVYNNMLSLDSEDISLVEIVLPLLSKWDIEDYCIYNRFGQLLQSYQPVLLEESNTREKYHK